MVQKRGKPTTGKVIGFRNIDVLPSKIDAPDITPNPHQLQARRIRSRFGVSWPLARLTAELHFGRAAT